jgi:hypothetical protein
MLVLEMLVHMLLIQASHDRTEPCACDPLAESIDSVRVCKRHMRRFTRNAPDSRHGSASAMLIISHAHLQPSSSHSHHRTRIIAFASSHWYHRIRIIAFVSSPRIIAFASSHSHHRIRIIALASSHSHHRSRIIAVASSQLHHRSHIIASSHSHPRILAFASSHSHPRIRILTFASSHSIRRGTFDFQPTLLLVSPSCSCYPLARVTLCLLCGAMLIHDMTTLGRASFAAVLDEVLCQSHQAPVAMPSL